MSETSSGLFPALIELKLITVTSSSAYCIVCTEPVYSSIEGMCAVHPVCVSSTATTHVQASSSLVVATVIWSCSHWDIQQLTKLLS